MVCLNCGKRKAQKDEVLGWLPCKACQKKHAKVTVKQSICLEGEGIKSQRREFNPDIIQPFRQGVLSKEYVDKYGTKGLNLAPGEEKKAQIVWSGKDTTGYMDYYKE